MMNLKSIIIKTPLFGSLIKKLYHFSNDKILNFFFQFSPEYGSKHYANMQKKIYNRQTLSFLESKNLCVGAFTAQENYPYKKFLLEHYKGKYDRALDFACGMGRMMRHMSNNFQIIDGVDLVKNNLDYANTFLKDNGINSKNFNLYHSDGLSVKLPIENKYDFIYSTIALQHICVHKIRLKIIKDLYEHLNQDGSMCLQFGFGYDNGIRYFDNFFAARSTNSGNDVCIPNENFLPLIEKEFLDIGFKKVIFELKISPHPLKGNLYHPIWIFIHLKN